MTTFRDFLVWYNLDVEPFAQAVKNLQNYYFEQNIDIFKCSISVPGLARRMLFESGTKKGASFALIDHENEDLIDTIKQNIIGGLASYSNATTRPEDHSFLVNHKSPAVEL